MKTLDWSTFTKRIDVNASIPTIYKAWTSQEGLESWFLSKAEFQDSKGTLNPRDAHCQIGNAYTWMWHGSDYIGKGKVLDSNGKDAFSFTFEACNVHVTLRVEEGKHIVNLQQTDIPLDDHSRMDYYMGCSEGWTFYLANLKSILEGGLDLRNKDHALKRMINT